MKTRRIICPLLAVLLGGTLAARTVRAAQAGNLDTSFNANVLGTVSAVAVQNDGKILVAGSFGTVNGASHLNLARLNADGSLDTAFTAAADAPVRAMVLQPDGKILVGGSFGTVNGVKRGPLARLNADGSLDAAFDASASTSDIEISYLACGSDGRIVTAGSYLISYGGKDGFTVPISDLERFNADGGRDASFNFPGASPLGFYALAVQADNKVLYVRRENPGDYASLSRLKADGSHDDAFTPLAGSSYAGADILVQPDGQIVTVGPWQGTNAAEIIRLNAADGSVDPSFHPVRCGSDNVVKIIRQPDGRFVESNEITVVNDITRKYLARLNADGTLDSGFVPPGSVNGHVWTLALQADGGLIIGGNFARIDDVAHPGIARLYGADAAVPRIASAATATGQVGVPFSYQITADNAPATFAAGTVYSLNAGLGTPMPAGLSFDPASGIISGTPAREGNYVLALKASNAAGADLKEITLTIATAAGQTHPPFFTGEEPLSNGVYYLKFFYSGSQPANYFSYYAYLSDPRYIYHFDLGYEYLFDADDGQAGVYLYDFASDSFFYTGPEYPFPFLYDFSLGTVLLYYGDPANPERYNTNGVRYFYEFKTGQVITK